MNEKVVQITNWKELDKYPLCLNCGTKLTAYFITPFGCMWACPHCRYDDYGKTIPIENIKNKKIKYIDDFKVHKPFGEGYYTYIKGVKQDG